MTALPSKHSSGCHMATEKEYRRTQSEKEIWRRRCGQQDTSTDGGSHRTGLDGEWWCGLYFTGSDRLKLSTERTQYHMHNYPQATLQKTYRRIKYGF